ncbi:hypothetical protein ABGB14_02935 [Nonomuraea sp. B10E15]|uniref:hypothetical protein n=1 Tax=Nonomuraea sp. B10E15 TaxID=3153560 RepID=UPI00325C7789
MDYYLIAATAGGPSPAAILVEEFVLCDDYTAAGIDTAAWRAAAQAYARLGGGELPAEPQLRARSERQPLPGDRPLDLGTSPGARRYRILFAGELGTGALASARTALGALLHHHRQAIRALGLIPVTIERFA